MLKKMFDFYRIVDPQPDDEVISKRKAAVEDLIRKLDDSTDKELLVASTAGAIIGFAKESKAVETIVSCITEHQPAFPSDLSENALEIRTCALVALGEIITRDSERGAELSGDGLLVSALLLSGTGLRPKVQERYLEMALDELRRAAVTATTALAASRRTRPDISLGRLEQIEAETDGVALCGLVRPVLQDLFRELSQQAALDREELKVLSWLYNNYAETLKKPLSALTPFEAALCCGTELADLVKLPPLNGMRQMVLDALVRNQGRENLKELSLSEASTQWTHNAMGTLVPREPTGLTLAKQSPPLVPLSWLCSRLLESGTVSGWQEEFRLKTDLTSTESYSPETIALQAFSERIAQRVYAGGK